MKPLRIGRNRQRLQLYDVPETSQDALGQVSQSATLLGTFWGESRMLRGNEQLNVRQIWPTATHQVTLRWLGSAIPAGPNNPNGLIIERMYLVDTLDGARLNILNANNVEKRNRRWVLTCEEKRSN